MKKYTAEFRAKGSYGTMICTEDSISELIETMKERGCIISDAEVDKIIFWDNYSKSKFYYGGFGGVSKIRKGEDQMTEYTSL